MPKSRATHTVEEAEKIAEELGYPVVIRPAYTLGGTGGGFVYNVEELRVIAARGISASLVGQILVEESVLGWEELELEVVRDAKNQMITVCFIENVDASGCTYWGFILHSAHAHYRPCPPKQTSEILLRYCRSDTGHRWH